MKFKFSEDQENAIKELSEFLKDNKKNVITLSGEAGTGKTTVIKEVIKNVRKMDMQYTLCAPTNKAALIMQEMYDDDSITIHKLLAMSPSLDIFNLDLRSLLFKSNESMRQIPNRGVVILDECSMLNDDLYDMLVKSCEEMRSKIIFVGDVSQIRAVGSDEISKAFKGEMIYLRKIHRQSEDSEVYKACKQLRTEFVPYFETTIGENGSIIVYDDISKFIKKAAEHYQAAIDEEDTDMTKMFAYTNERCYLYNKCLRKFIFENDEPDEINKGEFLTAFGSFKSKDGGQFITSCDYIVQNEPRMTTFIVPVINKEIKGYYLTLKNNKFNKEYSVFLASMHNDKSIMNYIAEEMENIRKRAIMEKTRRHTMVSGKLWKEYFMINESFVTMENMTLDDRVIKTKAFDYGYCLTGHKSQGSTYGNVFIDIKNIKECKDKFVRRELEYVTFSRTKNDVNIFQ